jgi:hypothetical protein
VDVSSKHSSHEIQRRSSAPSISKDLTELEKRNQKSTTQSRDLPRGLHGARGTGHGARVRTVCTLPPSHSMYAWTPRLFSGDAELRESEPLLSAFEERLQRRESRTQTNVDSWTESLIDRLIRDAHWVRVILTTLCQFLTLE